MKIALKPTFWLATPNVFLDSLVLSGRQLCVLTCVVLITSFAKVYQAYCLQLNTSKLEQTYRLFVKETSYRNALLLEKSTLLNRAQIISQSRNYLHMTRPVKVVNLVKEGG